MASYAESERSEEAEGESSDSSSDEDDEELAAYKAKFSQVRMRIRQTETDNRKDLVAEQNSKRVPASVVRKLERKRKEALDLVQRRELAAKGEDFERHRSLTYSVHDVEAWDAAQAKKRARRNTEFLDHRHASHKKYQRMIAALTPDLAAYEDQRTTAAVEGKQDAFYGSTDALDVHARPDPRDVERMAADVRHQVEIRNKSSRRRTFDPDEDVGYINDKNRDFNRKIARAYDKYTAEIKDSLERGTAL
ncbi:Pre-mRNA-splicing factor SYF2 [Blastocladiella emersonii ATCC 22665]|nr:Pre-mRNA-splicing factor SYF2 [Blastocladiella emersonii ATCC 22665]